MKIRTKEYDCIILLIHPICQKDGDENILFWCVTLFENSVVVLAVNVLNKKPSGSDLERRIKTIPNLKSIFIQSQNRDLLEKRFNDIGILVQDLSSEKTIFFYEKYFEFLLNEFRYNDLTLFEYLKTNNFSSDKLKEYFTETSIDSWNKQVSVDSSSKRKEIQNVPKNLSQDLENDKFLKKKEDLNFIKKELLKYPENAEALLLSFRIDNFLKDLNESDNIDPFYQLVERKIKKIGIQISKDDELIEKILSKVGKNSLRNSEYRIIQFQIIYILIAYSNLNTKSIRTLDFEQLKSLLNSSTTFHPKGIELLKEKMVFIEIFFEKYPSLGCCLKNHKIQLMVYIAFSSMINEELKRVLLELKKESIKLFLNLITTRKLKIINKY